jgi:hypothetical protein
VSHHEEHFPLVEPSNRCWSALKLQATNRWWSLYDDNITLI